MAPRAGFEPATLRLTAACSTVELPRNGTGSLKATAVLLGPPPEEHRVAERKLTIQANRSLHRS